MGGLKELIADVAQRAVEGHALQQKVGRAIEALAVGRM
jgi:hypothetical protein